ncbi:hypothetical protein B566_EDAN005599 [Ephemera danica]|nr:hypothetical protein B566_EDAN005599 [Ephemera danica]
MEDFSSYFRLPIRVEITKSTTFYTFPAAGGMDTGDLYYLDTLIKQEPGQPMDSPPGVPIPSRGRVTGGRVHTDFNLDLDEALTLGALPNIGGGTFNLQQQLAQYSPVVPQLQSRGKGDPNSMYYFSGMALTGDAQPGGFAAQNTLGPSVWVSLCDTFKMDEDDDILQVDESDLIQGPTLAELNANDETLLADLSFDDLLLPEDAGGGGGFVAMPPASVTPSSTTQASSYPASISSMLRDSGLSCSMPASQNLFVGIPSPPAQLQSPVSPRPPSTSSTSRHSTLHELLMRRNEPEVSTEHTAIFQLDEELDLLLEATVTTGLMSHTFQAAAQLSPGSFNLLNAAAGPSTSGSASRLSSSAPTHLGLEQIWQRREPRQHLLSTGSLVEAGSTSSLSTGGVLSPASHELSHDEGFDSEDDSEHYDDFDSSDGDSSDEEGRNGSGERSRGSRTKKERYFWQYNVQAKGPKGQRLVLKTKQEDPHVLNEVTDPVFSPSCAVRGIKHSGKARKGDGNDLTPNPRKLHSIGKELDKLGRVINDMTPVSELPLTVRPKSRKEKNKLASRACRLKKKAQHEANKIKLFGLEHEHRRLIAGIQQVKSLLAASYNSDAKQSREELTRTVEKLRRLSLKLEIAGVSTDFVNRVLEKVKAGVPGGGLEDI